MTPWTAALQASLSFTISQSLLKFMSIESATPSSHLVLCHPLLLLPYEQTKPLWLSWLSLKISSVDDLRSPALNIRKRYSIFVSVTEFKKVLDILFPLLYRYIFSWFFLEFSDLPTQLGRELLVFFSDCPYAFLNYFF